MSERVDIWTVYYNGHDAPVLVKSTARVTAKRVVLEPYDPRFGDRIEYARHDVDSDVFGRGGRITAPAHWFSVEAAMHRWRDYIERQVQHHELGVIEWDKLRDVEPLAPESPRDILPGRQEPK